MTDAPAAARVLPRADWSVREGAHEERVDALTAGHRARRGGGGTHPVEDFLFTYYRHSPGHLRRWHPGPAVVLEDAAGMPRAGWPHYVTEGDGVRVDVAAFVQKRCAAVDFVRVLLSRTAARPPRLGCFGLHEWAMVYRATPEQVRHSGRPLRLGSEGTDAVVETHRLQCTHHDAYRFFTPDAEPRNATRPTREGQLGQEQPGCLHAAMDLYKWAYKLAPVVPSELTADCFELARDVRELDMRASPYDLRDLGYEAIRIETAEGKATYVAAQREVAERGNTLRGRLLTALDAVRDPHPRGERAVSN